MNKKELKDKIKPIIMSYMNMQMAFTGVDICNAMRVQYPKEFIRYKDIATLLRKIVLNFSHKHSKMYCVSLIIVNTENSNTKAYLYHPENYDPNNYMSRDQVTFNSL